MNMDINYVSQFKSVIEDIVKSEIKKAGITNYISAIVKSINGDGTINVYLPPNEQSLITGLYNKTGEIINVGDSVEIATKSGSLTNSWIAIKHGNERNYIGGTSSTGNFLKLTGGDLYGNLRINNASFLLKSTSDTNDFKLGISTPSHDFGFKAITNNHGIYDFRNNKWVLYSDSSSGEDSSWHFIGSASKDGDGNTISSTYLKLSGGAMTGDISFKGTKATTTMIKWLDNTQNAYGNGISICGGGLTILGSGESADTFLGHTEYTPATETTIVCSDAGIELCTNLQNAITDFSQKNVMAINSNGSVTKKNGVNMAGVFIQSSEPTAVQTGDIWFIP